jgi:hypothetical protein
MGDVINIDGQVVDKGGDEPPTPAEMQQQGCAACRWPHFIIYTAQVEGLPDPMLLSQCTGCNQLSSIGVYMAPDDDHVFFPEDFDLDEGYDPDDDGED